jgi:hypothetical protein
VTDNVSQNPVVDADGGLLIPSVPDATSAQETPGEVMRLRRHGDRPSERTGYVGDHTDKLSRIAPIRHNEDERPRREDREYGQTIFTRPLLSLPRFLISGRKRQDG